METEKGTAAVVPEGVWELFEVDPAADTPAHAFLALAPRPGEDFIRLAVQYAGHCEIIGSTSTCECHRETEDMVCQYLAALDGKWDQYVKAAGWAVV